MMAMGNPIQMHDDVFLDWPNGSSNGNWDHAIALVKFVIGSSNMYWKESMESEVFLESEFPQKRISQNILEGKQIGIQKEDMHGIPPVKKADIQK